MLLFIEIVSDYCHKKTEIDKIGFCLYILVKTLKISVDLKKVVIYIFMSSSSRNFSSHGIPHSSCARGQNSARSLNAEGLTK